MRGILMFSAVVLAAGGATAAVPSQPPPTQPERMQQLAPAFKLGGSVFLMERPLPGSVLHYPGMFTPLRGPHGGLLAQRRQQHIWRD